MLLPAHPRTRAALERQGITVDPAVHLVPPQPYHAMLGLLAGAAVVATDSGGLQKEAAFARVPCVTLRDETEWQETVTSGWNRLAPLTADGIADAIAAAVAPPAGPPPDYGDGDAAGRILAVIAAGIMKILYAVRMFSGLQSSLAAGRWQPTGVPTIYKMIEALDRGADMPVFVLACKDIYVDWPERRDRTLVAGRAAPSGARAGRAAALSRVVAGRGRAAARACPCLDHRRIWRRERPDLVYLDHANVFVAGWLALATRARIVFRVMGVYPVMRAALDGGGLGRRLLRWCYRRRFALVVCSQDGSGVEPWLERALRPDDTARRAVERP